MNENNKSDLDVRPLLLGLGEVVGRIGNEGTIP